MGSGASNTNGIGRTDFMDAKIGFIDFAVFRTLNEIPRMPEDKKIFTEVKKINFMEAFVVFVSHHWLRTIAEEGFSGKPHPDSSSHEKLKLINEGILQLKNDACPR
jgi:hypothetical protein